MKHQVLLFLTPAPARHQMRALLNETPFASAEDAPAWQRGAYAFLLHALADEFLSAPQAWLLAIVAGAISASVDLHASTRLPYALAMFVFAGALGIFYPRWSWRWAFAIAAVLPLYVLITSEWGPYAQDKFDALYGVVPAALASIIGARMSGRRLEQSAPPVR